MIGKWYKTEFWAEFALKVLPCGSQVTCSPPPVKNSDVDYLLLLAPEHVRRLEERLWQAGWNLGGSLGLVKPRTSYEIQVRHKKSGELSWIDDGSLLSKNFEFVAGPDKNWVTRKKPRGDLPTLPGLLEYPDFSKKDAVFRSWKESSSDMAVNLILTCSEEYFSNFEKATLLCSRLNLLDKADRVAVFEGVCFDNWSGRQKSRKKTATFFHTGTATLSNMIQSSDWGDAQPQQEPEANMSEILEPVISGNTVLDVIPFNNLDNTF